MRYSKGVSWIDDCRIPFVDEGDDDGVNRIRNNVKEQTIYGGGKGFPPIKVDYIKQGRFPANILVCDDMLNDGNIGQNNSKNQEWKLQYKSESHIYGKYKGAGISRIADKGSNSRYYDIDKWFNNLIDG
jgi:hypothetical protein